MCRRWEHIYIYIYIYTYNNKNWLPQTEEVRRRERISGPAGSARPGIDVISRASCKESPRDCYETWDLATSSTKPKMGPNCIWQLLHKK